MKALLDIHEHNGSGYKHMIDFQTWRVALMNDTPDCAPEMITLFQRHDETDEVFVLLAGRCILFLGEGNQEITKIYAVDMQPKALYTIKKGSWHSHTFSPDAKVLIVENANTTETNSPVIDLTPDQRGEVIAQTRRLWG